MVYTFLFFAGILVLILYFVVRPGVIHPTADGTKCGTVEAHQFKYRHESCDGSQDLVCMNCGLEGFLTTGRDEDRYHITEEGMFLHPSINADVHYLVENGSECRKCQLDKWGYHHV